MAFQIILLVVSIFGILFMLYKIYNFGKCINVDITTGKNGERLSFKEQKERMIDILFQDKDMKVVKYLNLKNGVSLKFYDLNKYEDGRINRDDINFMRIAKIVNKYIDFKIDGDELDISLADFNSIELKYTFIDLMSMCTNFNMAQFIFKGEDKFKLFSIESKAIDEIKEHTHKIISQTFIEIVEIMKENGLENNFEE